MTVGAADPYRASTEGLVQQLRRLRVSTDFELIPGGGHGGRLFWDGLLFGLKVIEPQLAAMPAPTNPTRG